MNITSVDYGELIHGVLLKDARRECMAPRDILESRDPGTQCDENVPFGKKVLSVDDQVPVSGGK